MTQGRYFVGWDVGGAHLKMACVDRDGRIECAGQWPAPIWRGLGELQQAMTEAQHELPQAPALHAVTMTAELADCFPDRDTGVCRILDEIDARLPAPIRVYSLSGFLDSRGARGQPPAVASANWHAAACLAAATLSEGIFVDVGSTTTDIIPLRAGKPVARGATDRSRMQYDELVYTGVARTPVMALARRAPVGGRWQHLAAEVFATMADVYALTGDRTADAATMPAADGGGYGPGDCARRLARMAGTDVTGTESPVWLELARYLKHQQLTVLGSALRRVLDAAGLSPQAPLIGAGCGRFLVRTLASGLNRPYRDVAGLLPVAGGFREAAAVCWPACAVAELLRRESSE